VLAEPGSAALCPPPPSPAPSPPALAPLLVLQDSSVTGSNFTGNKFPLPIFKLAGLT
jgi:hypothetical protein